MADFDFNDQDSSPTRGDSEGSGRRKNQDSSNRSNRTALIAVVGGLMAILLVGGVYMLVRSSSSSGNDTTSGREQQKKDLQAKSMGERAMKLTGGKLAPSAKPAEPGSVQDFFDAVSFMADRMPNVPLRHGTKVMVLFKTPGIEASTWQQVFGEPEKMSRGRERPTSNSKTEVEFDRWRHLLTDGAVVVHGQIVIANGKTYYHPTSLNIE